MADSSPACPPRDVADGVGRFRRGRETSQHTADRTGTCSSSSPHKREHRVGPESPRRVRHLLSDAGRKDAAVAKHRAVLPGEQIQAPVAWDDPDPLTEELDFSKRVEQPMRYICVYPRQGYERIGPGPEVAPMDPNLRALLKKGNRLFRRRAR